MHQFVTEMQEFLTPLVQLTQSNPVYPTIDHDALLDMLIEHLERGKHLEWYEFARSILFKGELIETVYLANGPQTLHFFDARRRWELIPIPPNDTDLLINAIAQVGQALEAHLSHFGLYRDRQLHYAYQGCAGNEIYEFVRKPDA